MSNDPFAEELEIEEEEEGGAEIVQTGEEGEGAEQLAEPVPLPPAEEMVEEPLEGPPPAPPVEEQGELPPPERPEAAASPPPPLAPQEQPRGQQRRRNRALEEARAFLGPDFDPAAKRPRRPPQRLLCINATWTAEGELRDCGEAECPHCNAMVQE